MPAFALTIFTGAFLLFQVQPLMGKFVLPWFGGSPGVWTTCMLFFQVLLLGGYTYAHLSARWLRPKRQALLHITLVAVSALFLPVVPGADWKPLTGEQPVLKILGLLAANVGLPYFALAATGPLVQHWFGCAFAGKSPYRLYALSNAGSLLALLSYPFLFEPLMSRQTQAHLWGAGLVLYLLSVLACARRLWPLGNAPDHRGADSTPLSDGADGLSPPAHSARIVTLLWLALPACASALLLAVTNKLCLDVAVFPFLWIVPLALYLLSFIVAFDSPRWYQRGVFTWLLVLALGGFCWALYDASNWTLWRQVWVFGFGLFVCCMICHGELYRLRPEPARLTGYYLLISAGGALGGIFVGVVAPFLFNDYYELHLALVLTALLYVALFWADTVRTARSGAQVPLSAPGGRGLDALVMAVFVAAPAGVEFWIYRQPALINGLPKEALYALRLLVWSLVPGLVVAQWLSRRGRSPLRARVLTATWLTVAAGTLGVVLVIQANDQDADLVYQSRNFYGVLSIMDHNREHPDDRFLLLRHGRITHGLQFTRPALAKLPTTYYGPGSGVGLAINALPPGPRRIGVVGLGTGTLAAYGRPGDTIRFYEIDPEVVAIAWSRFTYLSNCLARIEIAPGDARLSLEREEPRNFNLLILDAFNSDAVPVHLLTREAFAVYERHLATNGILAVHISNHFLDLEPVVLNLAKEFRRGLILIDPDEDEEEWWIYGSTWALMSRDRKFYDRPEIRAAAIPLRTNAPVVPLWTDDFASLYQVMRAP